MTSATQDQPIVSSATVVPNQYHLHGKDITVSFFPEGSGPVIAGQGRLRLVYQDSQRSLTFFGDQVRTVDVLDLGTVVSVTLVELGSFGRTTVSVVIPPVDLPPHGTAQIATFGVTEIHVGALVGSGHPQQATYRVTKLRGMASDGILPA